MANNPHLSEQIFNLLTFKDADIIIDDNPESITITVTVPEESSGILIGYRGEKINALQLLLTLMLNNNSIAYRPIHLDINGYRQKRQQLLREMADAAAQNALDSGREILLPPLPAYERRTIHLHLEENPNVETYSEGESHNRRLVVRPSSSIQK